MQILVHLLPFAILTLTAFVSVAIWDVSAKARVIAFVISWTWVSSAIETGLLRLRFTDLAGAVVAFAAGHYLGKLYNRWNPGEQPAARSAGKG